MMRNVEGARAEPLPHRIPARPDGRRDLERRPTADLVKELVDEGRVLLREEAALMKDDVTRQIRGASKAGALAGAGTALVYAGVLALVAAIALGFATRMHPALAALITGLIVLAVGALVAWAGAALAKRLEPARTIETLREDKRWARRTMHDVRRARESA